MLPLKSTPRRSSVGGTAIRTVGAISGTLASLSTPSRAFRSMTSLAIKTTASLAGLTPFRKGRVRSGLLASSTAGLGSVIVSSLSSSTPRSMLIFPTTIAPLSSTSDTNWNQSVLTWNDCERSSNADTGRQTNMQATSSA